MVCLLLPAGMYSWLSPYRRRLTRNEAEGSQCTHIARLIQDSSGRFCLRPREISQQVVLKCREKWYMKNAPIPSFVPPDGLILMLMSQSPLLKFGKLDHLQFTNGLGSRSSLVSCMLYMVLKEMLMNLMIKDPDEHSKSVSPPSPCCLILVAG